MYTRYFNLNEKPFNLTPDPKYLFLGANHKETYAQLLYSVQEEVGFVALIGEVGTGKTTICRAFLNQLPDNHILAFIFNPNLDDLELLKSLNKELGIPYRYNSKKELQDKLNQYLLEQKKFGKRVLLIIDEAQNLHPMVLEQIRLLSNLETETQKLINIILVGQPELGPILESPQLRQLKQRISISCRLYPLNLKETKEYIIHRLKMAGGEHVDAFTNGSIKQIFKLSKGTPRLINILCDRALLAAYSASVRKITPSMIRKCMSEINGRVRQKSWLARLASGLAAMAAVGLVGFFGFYYGGMIAEAKSSPIIQTAGLAASEHDSLQEPANLSGIGENLGKNTEVADTAGEPAVDELLQQAWTETGATGVTDIVTAQLAGKSGLTASTTTTKTNEAEAKAEATSELVLAQNRHAAFDPSAMSVKPVKKDNSEFKAAVFSKMSLTGSINAMLTTWGIDLLSDKSEKDDSVKTIFGRRGLELLTVNLTFNRLMTINYPVILEIKDEKGERGYLPVTGIWGKEFMADIDGKNSVEKVWALSHWTGKAFIPWKNFAN
ncbi:MAG: AAA family ATPase, partial [Nitrospinota bacterium]